MSVRAFFQSIRSCTNGATRDITESIREIPCDRETTASIVRQVNAANTHKRKPYQKFTDKNRWDIGKYCSDHGAAVTIRHFKSRLPRLKESAASKQVPKAYFRW